MKSKDQLTEIFKEFQKSLKKKSEFDTGKETLLQFRNELWGIYEFIFSGISDEQYSEMPIKKDKTIAYYIYHLNRIEDICANNLILDGNQVYVENGYDIKLGSPITTTGNELQGDDFIDFSKQIDIDGLKQYAKDVFERTNKILENMTYEQSKIKVSQEKREKLIVSKSVSTDENAFWLVDYWCKKDYLGLIMMPFTRHQSYIYLTA